MIARLLLALLLPAAWALDASSPHVDSPADGLPRAHVATGDGHVADPDEADAAYLDSPAARALAYHTDEFDEPHVMEVVPGNVYVAVGYGLANSVLIEGVDGVIIVDTMESVAAAEEVKAAFYEVVPKPVRAVVITHNHADHTLGCGVFTGGDESIPVIMHASALPILDRVIGVTNRITYKRAMRQFGTPLSSGEHLNSGIGPNLRVGPGSRSALQRPNTVFEGSSHNVTIEGVHLELYHAPGETVDQIVVWLPSLQLLCAADNVYKAFPNLYAIRGTPARDTMTWARAIELMRGLRPAIMVPSHTLPVFGQETIYEILTSYRDAIQFVHDQTVRYMNMGLGADEIAELVHLPPHLAEHPYLQEFYGTVSWSVKGVFHGYLGFFSGRPSELDPLSPMEEARHRVDLAGGVEQMAAAARRAFAKGEYQWALELSDSLKLLRHDVQETSRLRAKCLRALAANHVSANGRNYLFTAAKEEEGLNLLAGKERRRDTVHQAPIGVLMDLMRVNVDMAVAGRVHTYCVLEFSDIGETFTLIMRNGVLIVRNYRVQAPANVDAFVVQVESGTWKDLVLGERSGAMAYLSGSIRMLEGYIWQFTNFMSCFDEPERSDPEAQ